MRTNVLDTPTSSNSNVERLALELPFPSLEPELGVVAWPSPRAGSKHLEGGTLCVAELSGAVGDSQPAPDTSQRRWDFKEPMQRTWYEADRPPI